MATMHPNNLSTIDFNAESEEKVYTALRDSLPDSIHVFYSVRWQSQEGGKTKMGEADFVVIDPHYGFLVLEVKGGYAIENIDGQWRLYNTQRFGDYRRLKESPYAQASKSMFDLKAYYEHVYNQHISGVFGYAVVFPHYNIPEGLSLEQTRDNTIQKKDFLNLHKKLNEVFTAYRHNANWFTQDEFNHLVKMLDGNAGSFMPLSTYYQRSNEELQSLIESQDATLSMLSNYDQAIVVGPAGTGKTYLAITKAEEYAANGLKTLYLCFNRLNAKRVKSEFEKYHIDADCYTFHQLMISILGYSNYMGMFSKDKTLDGIYKILQEKNTPKYDAVIVDEAQDFSEEWALTICDLILSHKDSKLYVFYDEDQNIFDRNFGEAFGISYPPFVLRRNLRNTQPIWKWLVDATGMGRDGLANNIVGLTPHIYRAKNKLLAANWIEKEIKTMLNDGIAANEIIILTDNQLQNSPIGSLDKIAGKPLVDITVEESYDDCIKVCTIQAYKGLEAPVVLCLVKEAQDEKIQYVGFSRAKCLLYVVRY